MEKLSKERFDEILKLVTESPDKLNRGVTKAELISFAQELSQKNAEEISCDTDERGDNGPDEITKLRETLSECQENLKTEIKKNEELVKNLENSNKTLVKSENQIEALNNQYREILPRVNKYRVWCIILIVAVILQWIF